MKVFNKVVIDMTSFEVIEEDSYEYIGEVVSLKGGGASGAVDFPDYMEDIHVDWLTGGTTGTPSPNINIPIEDVMDTALGNAGNPFAYETSFNPDYELALTQDRYEKANDIALSISPDGDWEKYIDIAAKKLDDIFSLELEITNQVEQFEKNIRRRRRREISLWAGGMADINAVQSSQFVIGKAIREGEITAEVNQFESTLRLEQKRAKSLAVVQGVNDMIRLMLLKVDSNRAMSALQAEINRVNIIAQKESKDRQLEIDSLQASWDLKVFQYGSNMLAAISGAAHPIDNKPGVFQSILGLGLGGLSLVGSLLSNNKSEGE